MSVATENPTSQNCRLSTVMKPWKARGTRSELNMMRTFKGRKKANNWAKRERTRPPVPNAVASGTLTSMLLKAFSCQFRWEYVLAINSIFGPLTFVQSLNHTPRQCDTRPFLTLGSCCSALHTLSWGFVCPLGSQCAEKIRRILGREEMPRASAGRTSRSVQTLQNRTGSPRDNGI